MARTFGEHLMARHIHRLTVNPDLIRRIQAAPGMAAVTTFDELLETLGALTPAEELTIKALLQTYRHFMRVGTPRRRRG